MPSDLYKKKIPLYNVHIPKNSDINISEVLYSGSLANGPNVTKFESLFREYIGNPNITLTGDVSTSITIALYMAGVRPGDEVITSPLACLATTEPIRNLFAKVQWCDVDPQTGNMSVESLRNCITERTKAILIYHWAGNPADIMKIYQLARDYGIPVIEDAGEALGATVNGLKIGNTGADYTVFSFYPNRHITTIEGGAIAFRREEDFERGQWLKRYGIHQPSFRDDDGEINPASDIPVAGWNSYMNHVAATMGFAQMEHLPSILSKYQGNGFCYDEKLATIPGITILNRPSNTCSSYWVYTFLAENRDKLLTILNKKGICSSKVHIRNDKYSCFDNDDKILAGVDYFSAHCISIPSGWWVSVEEREYIIDSIRAGW